MKWFRSNIRLGSRLALFALAIQFLLSFGHFHGRRSGDCRAGFCEAIGASTTPSILPPAAPAHRSGLRWRSPLLGSKTSSGHGPAGHPGDDCAICAVMALANAMVDAAPPGLLAPHAIAFSYSAADAGSLDLDSASRAFQPRAPPIA